MLTTVRVANGEFEVYWNGEKTSFLIFNGSMGLSGKDTTNVYGISNSSTGKTRIIGTLVACKKILALTLKTKGIV